MNGHPATPRVVLSGWASASAPGPELEDLFCGRWDAKRRFPEDVGTLVDAMAHGVAAAGWWSPGSGAVSGGQIIAADLHALEPATRFGGALRTQGQAVIPSDFLFALPSSAAAMVGIALGLESFQATVTEHGLSAIQALNLARDLVITGRVPRVVVGALTAIGPRTSQHLGRVAGPEYPGPFTLAVACCLELRDAELRDAELRNAELRDAELRDAGGKTLINAEPEAAEPGVDESVLDSRELLGDLPGEVRGLAAPSLLALIRGAEGLDEGETLLLEHHDPCLAGVGHVRLRA